jgi:rhodanese-related sulfurtransferase
MPYVLIDLREASALSGGVVPGAVSIPEARLAAARDQFPKQKSAPVILYGSSDPEKAFAVVRGWGYKNASILDGGLNFWVQAGQALDPKPRDEISYVPKPRPGEIQVAEFRRLADSGSVEAIIVDVRGADETSQGMLKGAVNIPLTDLTGRLGELSKDKKIVALCNTGAQAEMAYNLLTEAGFQSSWLNAKVTVNPDGTYEVTKD